MANESIFDTIDPEISDRLVSRREAIRKGAGASTMVMAGLALGSIPIALGVLAKDAYGQAPADVLDALQFALLLENLEAEFYKAVLNSPGAGPQAPAFAPVRAQVLALPNSAAVLATLNLLRQHEVAHVAFLRTTIQSLGGTPATFTGASFDFTGGSGSGTGPFAPATQDLQFLLAVAQGVEDTGVRAYKGQAGRLINNKPVLEAALRIHSVEARHVSRVRRLRRATNPSVTDIRASGTIRGTGLAAAGAGFLNPSPAVVAAFNAIYADEGNTQHVVFNGTTAATIDANPAGSPGGLPAAQEAFDEPLTKAQVTAIVQGFIVA